MCTSRRSAPKRGRGRPWGRCNWC
uniref:Uncharacterized protein n=1 Tax=Arundo donax TaxID=35708 RepID=A0A0A8Z162_ARUDO